MISASSFGAGRGRACTATDVARTVAPMRSTHRVGVIPNDDLLAPDTFPTTAHFIVGDIQRTPFPLANRRDSAEEPHEEDDESSDADPKDDSSPVLLTGEA